MQAVAVTVVPVLSDNYVWVIKLAGDRVAVVDPGVGEPVINSLRQQGLVLAAVLLTHHHNDHCGGVEALCSSMPVPVYGPARERISGVSNPVGEGSRIELDGLLLEVWEVPGHTAGHVAYLGPELLLSGDTLFAGGCGRLFEGTAEQMWRSLSRMAALPGSTKVYCGHEYTVANLRFARQVEPDNSSIQERLAAAEQLRQHQLPTVPSTIELECRTNPFLRCQQQTVISAASRHAGSQLRGGAAVLAEVRRWKDSWR